ncbi:MAG: hypothetical protein U1E29_09620, partial [Coriobacteriia bacterium]|nr:hypothetical protein [Coriobacteriia bacterium]
VDHGDRVQEPFGFNLGDERRARVTYGLVRNIVIGDAGGIAEPTLNLLGDDARDLLRRPGRASSTAETGGMRGHIENLNVDGVIGSHKAPSKLTGQRRRHKRVRTPHNRGTTLQ